MTRKRRSYTPEVKQEAAWRFGKHVEARVQQLTGEREDVAPQGSAFNPASVVGSPLDTP